MWLWIRVVLGFFCLFFRHHIHRNMYLQIKDGIITETFLKSSNTFLIFSKPFFFFSICLLFYHPFLEQSWDDCHGCRDVLTDLLCSFFRIKEHNDLDWMPNWLKYQILKIISVNTINLTFLNMTYVIKYFVNPFKLNMFQTKISFKLQFCLHPFGWICLPLLYIYSFMKQTTLTNDF